MVLGRPPVWDVVGKDASLLSSRPDPASAGVGGRVKGRGEVSVSGPQVWEHPEASLLRASRQPWPRAFKSLRASQREGSSGRKPCPRQSSQHTTFPGPHSCPAPAFRYLRPLHYIPPINHYKGEERISLGGGLSPRRFSLEPHLDGSKLPYLYMFPRYWLQSEFLVWKNHP